MKELIEYRVKMIDRLAQSALEFAVDCRAHDAFARIEGSEWSMHKIAFHVRDVNKFVYGERVQKILHEDNPEIKSFDADGWMSAHYDQDESIENILSDFLKSITILCDTLRSLPVDAWSRESRHETFGDGLTLQIWVERGLAHIEEHLKVLK
jgi:hypothetical protein